MKKVLATALTAIATIIGTVATSACVMVIFDEPEMPDTLE